MPRKERKPRLGCFEIGERGVYIPTEIGLAHIREMAAIGHQPSEIDKYLQVSKGWLSSKIDEESDQFDADIAEAYDEGVSEFTGRLRVAQANLSETSAPMAIHMGKQYLGQKDSPIEHSHTHRVIGTLPDFKTQTIEDWQRTFVPEPVRAISDANVIDAEYEEQNAIGKSTP